MVPSEETYNIGVTMLGDGTTELPGMLFEMMFTFVLVLVIHAVCDPKRSATNGSAGLFIGIAVAAIHLGGVSCIIHVSWSLIKISIYWKKN